MISIIIPIYNAERYLRKCLESIRVQTYKDFEVLLIDDGSTDQSPDICRNYCSSSPHFHYLRKENGGVSSARNMGLEHALGEWISFIDADDWVSPDYLQTVMLQEPRGDINFISFYAVHTDNNSKLFQQAPLFASNRSEIETAIYALKCSPLGDMLGWTWNKFFRAEIIRQHQIRFCENISHREDEIFTLEYCRYIHSLRIIEQPLYNYRITPNGLTARGMQLSDLLPSSLQLEQDLPYYSHPALKEQILKSATDYRAKFIYFSPWSHIKQNLHDFQVFIRHNPQPGRHCKVNHLTQYLNKSYWLGYLYCLIRKI